MQLLAVMGIICCVLTMGRFFIDLQLMTTYPFLTGMFFIVLSLFVSMWELLRHLILNYRTLKEDNMRNLLIFTDLDGTLLDHDNYRFDQAIPALEKVNRLKIPLIINSSKTYAEIKAIRQKMHNN